MSRVALIGLVAVLLAACPSGPVVPPPVPPGPEPVDPPTPPGPATTPCERAHARWLELDCGASDGFVELCRRFAELDDTGGHISWDTACMQRAGTCEDFDRCRE